MEGPVCLMLKCEAGDEFGTALKLRVETQFDSLLAPGAPAIFEAALVQSRAWGVPGAPRISNY